MCQLHFREPLDFCRLFHWEKNPMARKHILSNFHTILFISFMNDVSVIPFSVFKIKFKFHIQIWNIWNSVSLLLITSCPHCHDWLGVNFTNIWFAAFAPKSFRQKITNPNCKHLKAVQRTLIWLKFTNILQAAFSYQSSLRTFYVLTIWVCNFLAKGFWRKSSSSNVGEI